jgi:D-sedoheptulose 7-phosphate isomerase
MNNIERLFAGSDGMEQFAKRYFSYLSELLDRLNTAEIAAISREIEDAHSRNNAIYIIGNGGSAATASHMANDIAMDVLKKSGIERPFRAFALTDNVPLMTAIANDDGYHNVFVNQLRICYQQGDILIAISASGNSPNVIEAAKWVKARKGRVMGFVGFDGGELKKLCDLSVHVNTPRGEYGPVEDIHLILDHLIANWLQYKMKYEK